jgi:hypothetical protein
VALEEFSEGSLIASFCGGKELGIGRWLSGNPCEVGAVRQSALLCSHEWFLLINCEKSFANSNIRRKQGDFAGSERRIHHEME